MKIVARHWFSRNVGLSLISLMHCNFSELLRLSGCDWFDRQICQCSLQQCELTIANSTGPNQWCHRIPKDSQVWELFNAISRLRRFCFLSFLQHIWMSTRTHTLSLRTYASDNHMHFNTNHIPYNVFVHQTTHAFTHKPPPPPASHCVLVPDDLCFLTQSIHPHYEFVNQTTHVF